MKGFRPNALFRRWLGVCLALAAGMALVVPEGSVGASEPVKVGVIVSLVGPAAGVGIANHRGFQLAVEEINRSGGIKGRPIKLIVEDDAGNPARANTAATKLIHRDNVVAILGASITPTSLAVSQVTNPNRVVQLSPTFTGDLVPGRYVFRVGLSDRFSVRRMVELARNFDRIGILVNVGPSGQSVRNAALRELKAIGKEAVDVQVFEPGSPDVTPQLLNLRRAGAQVLLIQALPGDTATVVRGIKQLGWDVQIIGHLGFADPVFRRTAGADAEGSYVIDTFDPEKPEFRQFQQKYFAKFGPQEMVYWGGTIQGYDAVYILAEALKRADFDRARLLEAMESIKDFPVVSGGVGARISYSPENHYGLGYDGAVALIVHGKELVRAPAIR